MKFVKGDLIIGLPKSDLHYKLCNSKCLMKVEELYDDDTLMLSGDILVSIVAFEHKEEMEKGKRCFLVDSEFFRKVTQEEKAVFIINLI